MHSDARLRFELGSAANRPPFIYVWWTSPGSRAAASRTCAAAGLPASLPLCPSVLRHHPNDHSFFALLLLRRRGVAVRPTVGPCVCPACRPGKRSDVAPSPVASRMPNERPAAARASGRPSSLLRTRGRGRVLRWRSPTRCIGRAPKVPLLSDERTEATCGKEKLVPTVAAAAVVAPHIHDRRTEGRTGGRPRSVHPSVLGEGRDRMGGRGRESCGSNGQD